MSGLLEVLVLDPRDAERAERGGADRVQLVGSLDDDGYSPTPELVARVRAATSVQLRVLLRLREGFSTDGGEFTRLRGLTSSYLEAGADGMVLGFLTPDEQIDASVVTELIADGDWPWTFDRAIDRTFDYDRAWREVQRLPRLDQVLTAGSARGLDFGLDEVIARARELADPGLVLAGGGLTYEQMPWLTRAGVRNFHLDLGVRPGGLVGEPVEVDLVRGWRALIDRGVARAREQRS